ncbi:hypothetical protein EE612_053322, partial [Oryza sativa]
SEYAVWRSDAGRGSLLASLAEAAFLTGLEKNSDVVQMASYAPLFVNNNDQTWNPDAIVFNSWQQYGTPSYWMQTLFGESSGAMFHPVTITSSYSGSLAASAITWQDSENSFLRVKIINFGSDPVSLTISATGLQARVNALGSTATVLTSSNVMDENSFSNPNKVVPVKKPAFQCSRADASHACSSLFLLIRSCACPVQTRGRDVKQQHKVSDRNTRNTRDVICEYQNAVHICACILKHYCIV